MKISVKVKARARQEKVEKVSQAQYKVWVKAAAEKGKANEAVIEAMAGHLDKPKSRFRIISGQTSSQKIVEVS